MHGRRIAIAVGTLSLVTLAVRPAWARPGFEQKSIPKGALEKRLELQVPPNAKGAENSHIEIFLPEGFDPHECTAALGWTCSVAKRDPGNRHKPQVSFSRQGCTAESSWRCLHEEGEDESVVVRAFAGHPRISDADEHEADEDDEADEDFVFEVDAPTQAGDYPIPVIQYEANPVNSERTDWNGPAGSEHPAPVVTVQ
jgi:uncharacterized protein YcnI